MQFKGISANSGYVKGRLCIVNDPSQFEHCSTEHVVLLNKVKPTAALAAKVKAILSIHGGVTSHAAIVARENNKPAVVGLPEEMLRQVQDGQTVTVKADEGTVEIL